MANTETIDLNNIEKRFDIVEESENIIRVSSGDIPTPITSDGSRWAPLDAKPSVFPPEIDNNTVGYTPEEIELAMKTKTTLVASADSTGIETPKEEMKETIEEISESISSVLPKIDLEDPESIAKLKEIVEDWFRRERDNMDEDGDGKISFKETMSWIWNKLLSALQFVLIWGSVLAIILGVQTIVGLPQIYESFINGTLNIESWWTICSSGGLSVIISTLIKLWQRSKNQHTNTEETLKIEAQLERVKRQKIENENDILEHKHQMREMLTKVEYELKLSYLKTDMMDKEIESKAKDVIARIEIIKGDKLEARNEELSTKIKNLEEQLKNSK